MSEQKTLSKAEARRERSSEANHLGMDTAAAGMAAGGLGLALLHHQMSEAKAEPVDARNSVDPLSATADRSIGSQPDRTGEHAALANGDRSEIASGTSEPDPGSDINLGLTSDLTDSAPRASEHHDHSFGTPHNTNSALEPSGDSLSSGHATLDPVEGIHSPTGGLQSLLSGASSTVTDITRGLEQKLDGIVSAASEAIDASLSAVSDQLSSLTSHIGGLTVDQEQILSQAANAATDIAGDLAGNTLSTASAVVDPIFHQAFGPASDSNSFVEGVVDTSDLASFGSTAVDAPIAFLGQSYTDVADHTVHGLQGLTHGLV